MVPLIVQVFQVGAREEQLTVGGIVEALDQLDNTGLSTAGVTNKGHYLVFRDVNRYAFKDGHLRLGWVAEFHIFNLYVTAF